MCELHIIFWPKSTRIKQLLEYEWKIVILPLWFWVPHAWFPLPGTVVRVPCFINCPCCLSVCFSLAPAPSPHFRRGPWYTSVNYGGRWPPVYLKSLNTCLRRVCKAAPVQFLTTTVLLQQTNKKYAKRVAKQILSVSFSALSLSPDGINLLFVSSSHSLEKPQS